MFIYAVQREMNTEEYLKTINKVDDDRLFKLRRTKTPERRRYFHSRRLVTSWCIPMVEELLFPLQPTEQQHDCNGKELRRVNCNRQC